MKKFVRCVDNVARNVTEQNSAVMQLEVGRIYTVVKETYGGCFIKEIEGSHYGFRTDRFIDATIEAFGQGRYK